MRLRRTETLALLLLVTASCAPAPSGSSGGAGPSGEPAASPVATSPRRSPRTQQELPTTAPEIELGNFDGELVAAQQMLAKDPHSLGGLTAITSIYLMRGQLYGRLADYDRAAQAAELAVASWPKAAKAWLARAAVRSRFHELDGALADLDRARSLGGDEVEVDCLQRRAAILQAQGKLQTARPIIEKMATALPSLQTIGTLATLDVDLGNIDRAEREFTDALDHFREVSPLPLVWLWLQQANMWEAEGSPARAAELLTAAHERLPADVSVTSHLAGDLAMRGERARAIALLRPLASGSDDPQYAGQLAELLGSTPEATQLRQQALRGYEPLLARHPAAFADHAARLMLAAETALPRALQLAELNLRVRQTAPAYALVIEAALANHELARACTVATAAQKSGARSSQLTWQSGRARAACGQPPATTAPVHARLLKRVRH